VQLIEKPKTGKLNGRLWERAPVIGQSYRNQ
jgi:hypothetical protein